MVYLVIKFGDVYAESKGVMDDNIARLFYSDALIPLLATDPILILWYTYIVRKKTTTNSNTICFPTDLLAFLPKTDKMLLVDFPYGFNKTLMASDEYYFMVMAYYTFHYTIYATLWDS